MSIKKPFFKSRNGIFVIIVVVLASVIIWKTFTQPGTESLKGNFKQVAFLRNEQNTGPVIRVYAVTVTDTVWKEMVDFGNYMPYNKYGNTKVYYFLNSKPYPTALQLGKINFNKLFNVHCLGMYQKDFMSQVTFLRTDSIN
ncbi:hypothetical protein ACVWYN_003022 [Pedobacter sp. UYP24]